jgi:ABC-type amino acid transport substrate-binding protein
MRAAHSLRHLSDLKKLPFRLGVQGDISSGKEFDALKSDPEFSRLLKPVMAAENAFQMMALGRIDGFIAEESTGLYLLDRHGLSGKIVRAFVVTAGVPAKIAFSKMTNSAAFIRDFNRALEAMMKDGTYKRLMEAALHCPVSVAKLGCK